MNEFPSEVQLQVDWHLTNRCNFYCEYCHPQIRRVLNTKDEGEPFSELISTRFNELGLTCGILLSGGEPFLFPDFARMCSLLTKHHYIKINTNLSNADLLRPFAETTNPSRVTEIVAAIHIVERERLGFSLDDYIANIQFLRAHAFVVTPLYVLYPPLLERAFDDIARMKNAGIEHVAAKVFKGVFEHKRYPEAYSPDERKLIQRLSGSYPHNQAYLNSPMCFRGRQCRAGVSSIKVQLDGTVQRCASVRGSLGNLYDGSFKLLTKSQACPASRILVLSECNRNLEPDIVDHAQ